MKIKIIYKVGKMEFKATADSIAEAYEYVRAIVKKEISHDPFGELSFDELGQYMNALVDIERGETLTFSGKIIALEILNPAKQKTR